MKNHALSVTVANGFTFKIAAQRAVLGISFLTLTIATIMPASTVSADATQVGSPFTPSSLRRGVIFFEGDSITAYYNNQPSSENQGYWSKLASQLAMTPIVNGQGDSGFVKRGEVRHGNQPITTRCTGTTFAQRLTPRIRAQIKSASIMVIEGGKNDFHDCPNDQPSTSAQEVRVPSNVVSQAASAYMDEIANIRADKDPSTVYVITPWAMHSDTYNRRRIPPLIKQAAEAHGFQYVTMGGVLDPQHVRQNTKDSIHPNAQGTTDIARALLSRSDIAGRALTIQRAMPK